MLGDRTQVDIDHDSISQVTKQVLRRYEALGVNELRIRLCSHEYEQFSRDVQKEHLALGMSPAQDGFAKEPTDLYGEPHPLF